jgi:hypothetical protein
MGYHVAREMVLGAAEPINHLPVAKKSRLSGALASDLV